MRTINIQCLLPFLRLDFPFLLSFLFLLSNESSAVALSRTRTQRARGEGWERGRREPRQKMTTRLVRGRGGGRKEGGFCSPASTPESTTRCSSYFTSGECSFFLGKRLTVRVSLLRLILLCCKRVFLCTGVGDRRRRTSWRTSRASSSGGSVRSDCPSATVGWLAPVAPQGFGGGQQGIIGMILFFS